MYFLGTINAQNKSPEELSALIADGLRGRYLKSPHVVVEVKQYNQSEGLCAGSRYAVLASINSTGESRCLS